MKATIARRILVRFATIDGHSCQHLVATWMDDQKAIAVAAHEHALSHKEHMIYQVVVEDLGELERDSEGVYVLNDNDLIDRMEW